MPSNHPYAADRPAASSAGPVQLPADDPDHPPVSLETLRRLSDRERLMPSGTERARVRAKLSMYYPALLDLVDELAADSRSPERSSVLRG